MNEPENFLARWSRRKLEAEDEKRAPEQAPATTATPEAHEAVAPDDAVKREARSPDHAAETVPAFDLTKLPSIESIDAATDIRVFLQAGVPPELTRAALRRAWTSDPTIRDFIGIAENQWDFTAPDGVPGFGPMQAIDDVRRMVAEITGDLDKLAEHVTSDRTQTPEKAPPEVMQPVVKSAISAPGEDRVEEDVAASAQAEVKQDGASTSPIGPPESNPQVDVAAQQVQRTTEYKPLPTRRSHGRALPE
jgi:hypothetical protein